MTEYAIDVFKLGSQRGLYCCYVSNGYMTQEALDMLIEAGLTGLKVDIKGGPETYERYCGGLDVMKVWENVRYALRRGVHVEIVNLVVTGVNEDEVEWVIESHLKFAGPDTPIHFTRYFPAHRFTNPPTKVSVLEAAVKAARKAGIHYAYMGNVHGHPYENTYCPECNEQVITRYGYAVVDFKLKEGNRCPRCGFGVKIAGKYVKKAPRWL